MTLINHKTTECGHDPWGFQNRFGIRIGSVCVWVCVCEGVCEGVCVGVCVCLGVGMVAVA